jgi:hypothetical protein
MRLRILAVLSTLGLAVATAFADAIIISDRLDGYGANCVDLEGPFPMQFTLYVVVDTWGLPYGGITGAEFSLRGLEDLFGFPPDGMFFWNVEASPWAIVVIGDPMGAGTNIAFSDCQSGTVHLFTLQMFAFGSPGTRELRVAARQPPTNPNFDCPLVVLCDAPVYTTRCTRSGVAYFDVPRVAPPPTDPFPPDGATGVPLQVTLRWTIPPIHAELCEAGTIWQNIYFGTNPDPPYVNSSVGERQYTPPPLAPNTTYYWRVQAGPDPVPVWHFTTGDLPVGVRPATWSDVRSLYR